MPLQEAVNGLVTGAAEAMMTQGRRPRLVRWTWRREVTHRFLYREQPPRLFADGALALCIREQPSDGSSRHDWWYGLFLLSTDLDDERLMRRRLERLLCWRESPERWPVYQHMPPLLILASSPCQRSRWQRAIEASALRLRLDSPAGALVCLPAQETMHGRNLWHLSWRTLSTNHLCHLQEWLRPLPTAALPPGLRVEEGEEEVPGVRPPPGAPGVFGSSGKPARLVLGNLAGRAACGTRDELEQRETIALLGLRLTARHWSILRLLLAHALLSDVELAAFLDLQQGSVRRALYELHRLGCLEPITTPVGRRWHLCERGLRLIASANHLPLRTIAAVPDVVAGADMSPCVQLGEAWLLQYIQHTAGIYGFFAGLAKAAKGYPEQALCWWETGAVCERYYRVGEQWYNLRPDALAAYRVGARQLRF